MLGRRHHRRRPVQGDSGMAKKAVWSLKRLSAHTLVGCLPRVVLLQVEGEHVHPRVGQTALWTHVRPGAVDGQHVRAQQVGGGEPGGAHVAVQVAELVHVAPDVPQQGLQGVRWSAWKEAHGQASRGEQPGRCKAWAGGTYGTGSRLAATRGWGGPSRAC